MVRLTDRPDMTSAVYRGRKQQHNNHNNSSKMFHKCDYFDFDIGNLPTLDWEIPRFTFYGVYISQLIRFARVSSHVIDVNARNIILTAKLIQHVYRYHQLRKPLSEY